MPSTARVDNRNASFTKRGPGRMHKQGSGKREHTLTFAASLLKVLAEKRAEVLRQSRRSTLAGIQRNAHGAFTLVGRETEFVDCKPEPANRWYELGRDSAPTYSVIFARRIWLAGISAQRGF